MTTSRARTLRTVSGALLASLLLAACSGGEPAAEDQPVEASSTPPSSSPTSATPTPTPTPTARPLSRFEDTPQVKVARKWAIAAARATTENDRTAKRIRPFVTPTGLKRMQGYLAEDMGRVYPGPVPFTPTAVRDEGGSAVVPMCLWVAGFTLDPQTKQPDKARRIIPAEFQMVRAGGKWRIDDMISAGHDCDKVPVKGRAF